MTLHPYHMPRRIRRDEADRHGYNPTPEDLLPPAEHLRAGEGVDRLAVFAAEVEAIRATFEGKTA